MKITAVDIYHYRIPFVTPIQVGQKMLDVREGFVLALTDNDGRVGYGEIAPLPGLDKTLLVQCRRDILSLRDRLIGAVLHCERFESKAPLLGIASVNAKDLSPWTTHTWFGLECALLGLFLQQSLAGRRTAKSRISYPLHIPVNGLFIPDKERENADRQIRKLKEQKIKIVKIKIGRMAADEEIRQILDLAGQMGLQVAYRLDGNRSLTSDLYSRYYEALRHLSVEYVEEPLRDGGSASICAVPWPIALDESLDDFLPPDEPRPSSLSPAVRTVILKPGLLNGLHAMDRWISDANRAGIKTVLSSAFNTGVTLVALGIFSRLAGIPPETAHGLDTLRYFAVDVLTESPIIQDGQLVIPESFVAGKQCLNDAVIRSEDSL